VPEYQSEEEEETTTRRSSVTTATYRTQEETTTAQRRKKVTKPMSDRDHEASFDDVKVVPSVTVTEPMKEKDYERSFVEREAVPDSCPGGLNGFLGVSGGGGVLLVTVVVMVVRKCLRKGLVAPLEDYLAVQEQLRQSLLRELKTAAMDTAADAEAESEAVSGSHQQAAHMLQRQHSVHSTSFLPSVESTGIIITPTLVTTSEIEKSLQLLDETMLREEKQRNTFFGYLWKLF
jgi:hypothetical protein